MSTIDRLIEYFAEFPGIGPRQARRFAYFLLTRNPEYISEFIRLVGDLKNHIRVCQSCQRFFQSERDATLCSICGNPERDRSELAIVSRDVDLDNIEKAHSYSGLYFVLGGTVPILEKNPEARIRSRELAAIVEERAAKGILKEIILAMNATPDGENTGDFVANFLKPTTSRYGIRVTHLGRGISTGTELEYSDAETIKNALSNRK